MDFEAVRAKVQGPAIGLIVFAVLSILGQIGGLIYTLIAGIDLDSMRMMVESGDPDAILGVVRVFASTGGGCLGMLFSVIVLVAGLKMLLTFMRPGTTKILGLSWPGLARSAAMTLDRVSNTPATSLRFRPLCSASMLNSSLFLRGLLLAVIFAGFGAALVVVFAVFFAIPNLLLCGPPMTASGFF